MDLSIPVGILEGVNRPLSWSNKTSAQWCRVWHLRVAASRCSVDGGASNSSRPLGVGDTEKKPSQAPRVSKSTRLSCGDPGSPAFKPKRTEPVVGALFPKVASHLGWSLLNRSLFVLEMLLDTSQVPCYPNKRLDRVSQAFVSPKST